MDACVLLRKNKYILMHLFLLLENNILEIMFQIICHDAICLHNEGIPNLQNYLTVGLRNNSAVELCYRELRNNEKLVLTRNL